MGTMAGRIQQAEWRSFPLPVSRAPVLRGAHGVIGYQAVTATTLGRMSTVSVWHLWQHNQYVTDNGGERRILLSAERILGQVPRVR